MRYENIRPAVFLARPNRFIAHVQIGAETHICHVKNTGRCRELLIPGAHVLVQQMDSPARKTAYDLLAVWKGVRLINIDAAAPNQVFAEWIKTGHFLPGLGLVKPEYRYGDSRFDFYLEAKGRPVLVEVKGVTLEEQDVVRFPDAPTQRGLKHVRGLISARREGFDAYLIFLIQMQDVRYFSPNWKTHAAFGEALLAAKAAGVKILALDCTVSETSLAVRKRVPLRLEEGRNL